MKKKTIYYVESEQGCGLRTAYNIKQAKEEFRKEVGKFAVLVRKATDTEIAWIKAMGGYVPNI